MTDFVTMTAVKLGTYKVTGKIIHSLDRLGGRG